VGDVEAEKLKTDDGGATEKLKPLVEVVEDNDPDVAEAAVTDATYLSKISFQK
jgi:hypothetical protein